MTPDTRKLGSQGPELTTSGFGSRTMGGAGWHLDDQTLREIDAALHTSQAAAVTS